MNTERLIDKQITRFQNADNVQKLAVVGTYGVLEANPAKRQDAERFHQRVRAIVERQLAIRGHDKEFTFKAFGFRWCYKPGAGE